MPHLLRMVTGIGVVLLIVFVGIPVGVHIGNVFTPTGQPDSAYPWTLTGILTALMQGTPMPTSTLMCTIGFALFVGGLVWAVSAAFGIAGRHQGRASILQLRAFVWWHSRRHHSAPLTAKHVDPLGRVGWFGFFGIRWFYDILEETRLLLAPTGAGKTVRFVVRMIFRARGAIVTTSTKPDVLELTGRIREKTFGEGTVMVYDPEDLVPWATGWQRKWDIVAGCENGQMAMKRAAAIVAARPLNPAESTSSGFFTQAATIVLQCMLHAAAVEGLSMREVMTWMGDFEINEPYRILQEHPDAIHHWVNLLNKYCRGKADETVSSTDMSLSGILNAFTIPEILDTVCPTKDDAVLEIRGFHRTTNSLYLICKGEDSPAASVFAALVESLYVLSSDDITRHGIPTSADAPTTEAADAAAPKTGVAGRLQKLWALAPVWVQRAARWVGKMLGMGERTGRPLEFILDEAMNVCAIPSLPVLMSTGRGQGLICTIVAQDFPQIIARYGEQATSIMNNATLLLVLPGSKDTDFLQKIQILAGTVDHLGQGFAKQVFEPSRIRTHWTGRAVMFYRNQPPAIITLPAWWRDRNHAAYQDSLAWANAQRKKLRSAPGGNGPSELAPAEKAAA